MKASLFPPIPSLSPRNVKASAKSSYSISRMYSEYILLPSLSTATTLVQATVIAPGASATVSRPGFFWLAPPFFSQEQNGGNRNTCKSWLRSFRWLSIRCKIEPKFPTRCRTYLSNLQSCSPPSSSSSGSQRPCQAPPTAGACTLRHSRSFWCLLPSALCKGLSLSLNLMEGFSSKAHHLLFSVSDPFFP